MQTTFTANGRFPSAFSEKLRNNLNGKPQQAGLSPQQPQQPQQQQQQQQRASVISAPSSSLPSETLVLVDPSSPSSNAVAPAGAVSDSPSSPFSRHDAVDLSPLRNSPSPLQQATSAATASAAAALASAVTSAPSNSSIVLSPSLVSNRPAGRVALSAVVKSLTQRWSQEYLREAEAGDVDAMCLSGDHRVLTRSGWKSITRLQEGDDVLSFNVKTYAQEWKPVIAVQSHAVDPANAADTLYRMQGSGMDVIATRDHRMLLARIQLHSADGMTRKDPIVYETVGQLLRLKYDINVKSSATRFAYSGQRDVVCSGSNAQPAVKVVIPGLERVCDWWSQQDDQRAFLQFLGFWLGHGYLDVAHGVVCIGQKKEQAKQWLEQRLLPRVFPRWWHCNPNSADPDMYVYTIRCPPLYNYLRLMAIGPLGYNPRDPVQLRSYPHFTYDAGLAAEEQKSDYYQADNARGRVSTWTEAEMLAAMRGDAAASLARCASVSAASTEPSASLSAPGERRASFSSYGSRLAPEAVGEVIPCMLCGEQYLEPDSASGRWCCPDCAEAVELDVPEAVTFHGDEEDENDGKDEKVPAAASVAMQEEDDDALEVEVPAGEAVAVEDPALAQAVQAAGKVVWWNNGLWIIINGHWFYLKRWLGDQAQIANVYSRLSRQQAIALLEGFCRADGEWKGVQYDDKGEPTGQWTCSNSSFPLIDHLQLIGQLAGAAIDLHLHTKAGKVCHIGGRRVAFSCDHWALYFSFTKPARKPMQTARLAQPVDVSGDLDARGYYDYKDDGKVYDITVQSNKAGHNANFLTQRLSIKRLQSGSTGVMAHSVFVGNCLVAQMYMEGWGALAADAHEGRRWLLRAKGEGIGRIVEQLEDRYATAAARPGSSAAATAAAASAEVDGGYYSGYGNSPVNSPRQYRPLQQHDRIAVSAAQRQLAAHKTPSFFNNVASAIASKPTRPPSSPPGPQLQIQPQQQQPTHIGRSVSLDQLSMQQQDGGHAAAQAGAVAQSRSVGGGAADSGSGEESHEADVSHFLHLRHHAVLTPHGIITRPHSVQGHPTSVPAS